MHPLCRKKTQGVFSFGLSVPNRPAFCFSALADFAAAADIPVPV